MLRSLAAFGPVTRGREVLVLALDGGGGGERFGTVEEITGRKRGRVLSYRRYLAILSEGTDPLPTTARKGRLCR